MGVPCLGLEIGGIRWIIPSQIGIKGSPNDFCHRQTFFLASFLQLFFLSFGDIDVNSFLGHLSHPFLIYTDIMLYNISLSERREQATCWSTSTSWMAATSNMLPLMRPFALSSSSATSVCAC